MGVPEQVRSERSERRSAPARGEWQASELRAQREVSDASYASDVTVSERAPQARKVAPVDAGRALRANRAVSRASSGAHRSVRTGTFSAQALRSTTVGGSLHHEGPTISQSLHGRRPLAVRPPEVSGRAQHTPKRGILAPRSTEATQQLLVEAAEMRAQRAYEESIDPGVWGRSPQVVRPGTERAQRGCAASEASESAHPSGQVPARSIGH